MEPNGRQVKLHPKSNTARALVFAILSILCSGCTLTNFEHPIESPDEANVPTELFGLYHGVNAKDYALCTLLVEPAKILGYVFLRVRLDADEIELALLDSTFVERAIDQGKVQGLVKRSVIPNRVAPKTTDSQPEITPEPKVESITVTAESDALRTFIRENLDRGLFSEKDNPRYRKSKEIPAANCI